MHIETLEVGPAQSNCHIVWNDAHQALVIDPGDESDRILSALEARALTVVAYLLTHGHVDHVSALAAVVEVHPAPVGIHADDAAWAFTSVNQFPPFYGPPAAPPEITRRYADGQEWTDAGFRYRVVHTPGHTPGGVCFYFETQRVLFVGDCLFAGSIGRTDLPGGHAAGLAASLQRLLQLPDATRVFVGHGPETTIGAERRSNPFLRGLAEPGSG